jgi:Zn-dependent M16 (insulinase) family peptidase
VKLGKLKSSLDAAVKDNIINLEESLLKSMPPIPNASLAPRVRSTMMNRDMTIIDEDYLFKSCQVVFTETEFVHLGLGINIAGISDDLRPYLVLFQELMFQSPLCLPLTNDQSEVILMDYKEVVKYSSELFLSHGMGVGFGNSLFSTSWCSQVLTLFTTSKKDDLERMSRFAMQVLLFSEFTVDRIVTICKNLLTNLTETKRDGDSMLAALANRLSYSTKSNPTLYEGQNDSAISVFKQEVILINFRNS